MHRKLLGLSLTLWLLAERGAISLAEVDDYVRRHYGDDALCEYKASLLGACAPIYCACGGSDG